MKKKMWAYMIKLSSNMWASSRFGGYEEELSLDENVWREVIDFLPAQGINTVLIDVGDGIQYESHPEVSVKGAWSKEKMKQELDHMRSIGLTPIPKLNFSAGHDLWLKEYSRMLSTPIYYRVCEDLIKEIAELLDYPEYFHLGMDEEKAETQRALSFSCIRQLDLWWHDAYFLFDVCEKVGARPWVWADFCWHEPQTYLAKMPKSVLQSNWYYGTLYKNPDGTYKKIDYQTYVTLEEAGFDQVPTSSTVCHWHNSLETMEMSKEHIAPERLVGHLTAAWQFTRPYARYMLKNDAYQFGKAKEQVYPEW